MANISIEVGTHFTKVVDLSFQNGIYGLEHAFILNTPKKQITGKTGPITATDYLSLAAQVKNLIQENNLNVEKLALALSGQQANILIFTLPKMTRQELNIAAVQEARNKIIPPPLPDAVFDYMLLGEKSTAGTVKQIVMVICAEKAVIDSALEFFRGLGAMPQVITVAQLAMTQTLYKNEEVDKNEAVAVLDIGANASSMSIIKGGTPYFYRNVFIGCADIVNAISRGLTVDEAMASQVLAYHGIPEAALPKDPNERVAVTEQIMQQKYEMMAEGKEQKLPEDVNPIELKIALETALDRLMGEIRRSLAFYKEHSGGGRVDKLFISGGGALIKGLQKHLSQEFGGEIKLLNPIRNIKLSEHKSVAGAGEKANILSVALGLGIELISRDYKQHINLLPKEIQRQDIVAKQRFFTMVTALAIMGVWLLGLGFLEWRIYSLKEICRKKVSILAQLTPLFNKLNALQRSEKRIKEKMELLDKLTRGRPLWPEALIALAKMAPPEVLLRRLNVEKVKDPDRGMVKGGTEKSGKGKAKAAVVRVWKLEVNGEINSDYESAVKILASFIAELNKSGYFLEAEMEPLSLEPVIYKSGSVAEKLTPIKKREFDITGYVAVGPGPFTGPAGGKK